MTKRPTMPTVHVPPFRAGLRPTQQQAHERTTNTMLASTIRDAWYRCGHSVTVCACDTGTGVGITSDLIAGLPAPIWAELWAQYQVARTRR